MLWLVLAVGVLTVGAKEIKFLTVLDDKEVVDALIKDPWSPIIGDTEGTRPITPRVRSWTGSSPPEQSYAPVAGAGRRANNLVENLRRQLMQDNYDYVGTDSVEHTSPTSARTSSTTKSTLTSTTTSPTTSTMTASTPNGVELADAMEPKFETSPYYQSLQSSLQPKQYPVARAQHRVSRMQLVSVRPPVFPMTRATATSTIPSNTRQTPATVRPYITTHLLAPVHPHIAAQPPAAEDPSLADNPSAAQNSQPSAAARPFVASHPPAAAPPSISFHPVGGSVQRFRSFDEAYNTPSPLLDQRGAEPKREVFKKDLLYYVDDDRLNTGLHLRRNNYLSSEGHHAHEHYEDSASALSAQSGQDMTTQADTSQQEHYRRHGQHRSVGRNPLYDRLRENSRHTFRKSKRRYKRKYRPVDGIKRRARLYGLRPKDYGYNKHDAPRELNRQQMNQHNSEYEPGDDNKRKDPYDAPINGQRNEDNFNFRRNNRVVSKSGLKLKNVIGGQNSSVSDKKDDQHSSHETDESIDDQETNTQIDDNNDKKHIVNTTNDQNKDKEIKQGPKKKEDANTEHKPEVNEDNIDNTHKIDEEHHESEEDGQRNTGQHNSQYLEETTSNVKYKLLKVRSLGGSRRSGSGGTQHILQERGSQGVALISMDQAPFPQFQLPRARRQYMQESGRARHPLIEQLPKPTSISRRKYKGHHRSSH